MYPAGLDPGGALGGAHAGPLTSWERGDATRGGPAALAARLGGAFSGLGAAEEARWLGERNRQACNPYVPQAATLYDGGCNPYVPEAATPVAGGCNPMCVRLQAEIAVDAEKIAAAYVQMEMDLYSGGAYTGAGQMAALPRPAAVAQA